MFFKYGLLVVAYLIGSIPFSVIFGLKFKGIDVRRHGSGNPGGTNSLRFLGKKVGLLVILSDVSKGALFVILIKYNILGDSEDFLNPLVYGMAATFGHAFSIYIKFRGGKAVGTGGGMIIAYDPVLAVIGALFFFGTLKLTKFVSMASTVAALSIVLLAVIFKDYDLLPVSIVLASLVLFRHQTNYKKIYKGIESKTYWLDIKKPDTK
ncbi:MAG: glycerol-3-phosphate 1-O-acyltransferase PlsY [Candidatus Izemoplasma sp.]